ncbi:MAG: DUF294 nucleotidyltransferase-like domain-containing protein [Aestuariivita sp.]|nr:DUF294 nucleotidyltransferase-like domain-containing protein [Aestuariivita sp.]MCY4203779.1 DUF294 nucleotidyltransferase-like domain-containing protein [Aestuariivita sp.]MCY4289124.1 DUF294 nucleotidyltransferase-like domain-containing protein [Aestuariivita sp.]MCY4347724.1 DUF294 nucleotidyltransferase-like domain-containing protein [Aestuariivita sp.]
MRIQPSELLRFFTEISPYASLTNARLNELIAKFKERRFAEGDYIYQHGATLDGLYVIFEGQVEIKDENQASLSILGPRNSFGERGLVRDGVAITSALARSDCVLLLLPAVDFNFLMASEPDVAKFFDRRRPARVGNNDLATSPVEDLMTPVPIALSIKDPANSAARIMAANDISTICVLEDGHFAGIVTARDLSSRIVGEGMPADTPLGELMTREPVSLSPTSIGSDVLHTMMERQVRQVPILLGDKLIGIVTQTDLTRYQAVSSGELIAGIAKATTPEEIAADTAKIPKLLVQLVAGGSRHDVVTRLITDIADATTRRLLHLGESRLGTPPAPYVWLACGSQGRQEQTGVSDQDNCIIIDDAMHSDDRPYFTELAKFVCDGLAICGYEYCPGDMMASNPRWCQPKKVWRDYFAKWIRKPDPEAQMLASVMFDLRPISGTLALYDGLQAETLKAASRNSIFVAHMIANSLKHQPPLGLLRGFATIRAGEYRNKIDLKHNGVVPVVDLGRVYALRAQLTPANTLTRLTAAESVREISSSGARDLIDAYDLIAETRLEKQALQIKSGDAADNFMAPSDLSDFERSHLRDAFVVIKTMQSALSQGKGMLS